MGGIRRLALPGALAALAVALPVMSSTTLSGNVLSSPGAGCSQLDAVTGSGPNGIGGSDQAPNGWALCPAGTQVNTERGTSGIAVSPETTAGQGVYAVTSGIFDEAVESINPVTLTAAPTLVSAAYQGVLADGAHHVWVSSGPENEVFEYLAGAPGAPLVDEDAAGAAPQEPNRGIPVTGYPGAIIADPTYSRLFVAGTLSVPDATVKSAPGGASGCPASDANTLDPGNGPDNGLICSVVNVVDGASGPTSSATVHVIAVGRDAYGLAFTPSAPGSTAGTLYVSNWADQTNPGRTGVSQSLPMSTQLQQATGTVSIVTVNADGTGSERSVVPVGKAPTGIAMAPDGRILVVANSSSDTLSVLPIDPATGDLDTTRPVATVPVGLGGPAGTQPMAVQFSPDGDYLFVALAGLNAVEVLHVAGDTVTPIAQNDVATVHGQAVSAPATYIPTGWWPDALAVGTDPITGADHPSYRLYVANMNGNSSGPGYYGQLQPAVGTGTEGTVSAIDVPDDSTRPGAFAAALAKWTHDVVVDDQLSGIFDAALAAQDPAQNPCVDAQGAPDTGSLLCQEWLYTTGARAHAPVTSSPTNTGQILTPHTMHVVFILAENKTFDAYFGDTGATLGSNADPSFNEYPLPVTTNQHDLARQFTLSDNFYNEGAEASVVGHSWWSSGIATAANMLNWGMDYDQGLRGNRGSGEYAEGSNPQLESVSLSGQTNGAVSDEEGLMQSAYTTLADDAYANGESIRVFATDVSPVPGMPSQQFQVCQPAWGENGNSANCAGAPFGNPTPGSDLAFPDSDRADIFLTGQTRSSHAWDAFNELSSGKAPTPPPTYGMPFPATPLPSSYTLAGWTQQYEACMNAEAGAGVTGATADAACQAQSMPNFTYMTLPENHTYDVSDVFNPLNPTPQSMVADNDYGVGKIIQGLSQSPFWKNTIVFLSEDDNQFTGDHVDIHRTFLLTMGGLASQLGATGHVSDERGSFTSALKTAEILLGLPPLTLFDWRAAPLQSVVAEPSVANDSVYHLVVPATPFLGGGPQTADPTGVVTDLLNASPTG
ncbi:MAG: YncE family protein [Acidimicrobiales bacterium]